MSAFGTTRTGQESPRSGRYRVISGLNAPRERLCRGAGHLAGAPIDRVSNRITHVKKGSFVNRQTNLRANNLDLVKHSHAVLQIDREVLPIL
jgi:hypothetical protein